MPFESCTKTHLTPPNIVRAATHDAATEATRRELADLPSAVQAALPQSPDDILPQLQLPQFPLQIGREPILTTGADGKAKPLQVAKAAPGQGCPGVAGANAVIDLDVGVADRFDAAANLFGGADYLARQLLRFGDVRLALAAYNAGPDRVARLGRVPAIAETRQYVVAVIDCYLALSAGRVVRTARDSRSAER